MEARLFILAEDLAVFMDVFEQSKLDVVNVEERRLFKKSCTDIQPGDYVVLRTGGGRSDYIPEVADKQLGKKAAALRSLQAEWKRELRDFVRHRGLREVERALLALGVRSPNLRYRLWDRSIRSKNPKDFQTLMEYIGLGERFTEMWTGMSQILSAHQRAGRQVQAQLELQVETADLSVLEQTGRLDVRLAEIDAGTLSVLRVEQRSPDTYEVPDRSIGAVFEMAND